VVSLFRSQKTLQIQESLQFVRELEYWKDFFKKPDFMCNNFM